MGGKAHSASGWRSFLWPGALLLLLMAGLAMLGSGLIRDHAEAKLADALDQQERLATGGVRTATQVVERTLDLTRTVHSVASLARNYHLRGQPQNAMPVEAILADLAREERSGILQVAMIDTDGELVFSSILGWQRMDLSDREHFRVHKDGLRTPFVSVPLVGRASDRWSVQVTQAILCELSGEFAGVVVVSVDPLAVSAALRQGQFGGNAYSTVTRLDGTVVARSHEPQAALGRRLPDATIERLQALPEGVGALTSPFSGEELTVAWKQMEGWPLIVGYGIRRAPAMEMVAEQQAKQLVVLGMAVGALAALYAAVLLWRSRRHARVEAARAEASRREMADLVGALPGAAYRGFATPGGALTLTQATEGLVRLTGRKGVVDALGMDWDVLLDEEGRKARAANLAAAIAQREGVGEYRLRHAEGHWIWVRDHARARWQSVPGRAEIVGVLSDITQEREMAAQAVSTAKLATLGEMATGLAHELNQPASAIALAADLASIELASGDPAREAKARDRLDMIVRQIMRMREIVQHLQIFGRVDPQSARMEAVSIEAAVAGAVGLVHGTLNASGVALRVDLPPGLPPVRGQLVPLEQVLVNLLLNARDAMDAMPPHGREVRITACEDAEAGEVRLRVSDTGPGFTPEQQARALEPFYTSKPPGKGTGLGLAIVYGTLRAFGGHITLGNGPAGGAELVLRLGRAITGEDAATPQPELVVNGARA